ncbi:DUF5683 domain-containing protein [Aestuariivivens sediminicola]|uniref:DUF5683 domain-containing protein n=1 Tax=Aestuariivivens sediminicola TaxID=2913560 RepID=UPI001F5A1C8A|nr:DUF5683 domain-containing protein [Aestuariivivens sediminicola]
MPNKCIIASALSFLLCFSIFAQENQNKKEEDLPQIIDEKAIEFKDDIDPLTPAKAAFLSAVLPGLGQAYNKKYWKIPIVYGALGTSIYFYINNNNEYNRYRDAYKSRLAGFKTDEFYFDSQGNPLTSPRITDDGLRRAQKFYRRNKELSLLVTLGLYALNIIDANVDAHLLQYNVDKNLSLAPHYKFNEMDAKSNLGLTLNFTF